jgi:hypothetical protein
MSTLRELLPQVRTGDEAYFRGYAMELYSLSYHAGGFHLTCYRGEGEWDDPRSFTEEELEAWLDDSYDDWYIEGRSSLTRSDPMPFLKKKEPGQN